MKVKSRNILLALCLSVVLATSVTVAAGPAVVVGEVYTARAKPDFVARQFRKVVHDSVADLDTAEVTGGPFVVSASLLRLSADSGEYGVQVTAVVATALRHKTSGNLIGTTEGRAIAAASGGSLLDAQTSALRAATESALTDVPRALRRR
jgi:hypothetical protein